MTALKAASYYADNPNLVQTARSGALWTISIDTPDGMVELELSEPAACWVRQGLEDAVCAACEGRSRPAPDATPATPETIRAIRASKEQAS